MSDERVKKTPENEHVTLDEARLREVESRLTKRIAEIDAHIARYPNSLDTAPRDHASDLRFMIDALSAERELSARNWQAYEIAHDQATENGQRASAERERADRAVGLLRRVITEVESWTGYNDDGLSADAHNDAQIFLKNQKGEA
jgi:hypothetical protein